MKEILVFTGIVTCMLTILIPAILFGYRNSVLAIIGMIILLVSGMVGILAFVVAIKGISHMLWMTPLALTVIFILIQYLKNKLTRPISILTKDIVEKLSKGKLNFLFNEKLLTREDELGKITKSLETMRLKMNEIMNEINIISSSIASSANTQSSAAMQLSQDATEQAASVEEISSTIEQITSNIQNNASNAQETEKISLTAKEGIENVFEMSNKTVDSTRIITDKIGIINEISFQTNILALNAAVEAARAGEHGKGFAVVASEVRKLAERSKASAIEIIKYANENLSLAEETGKRMEEMIAEVVKTSKLVQEISAASQEQDNGASQVNNSVQQLNSITQKNASTSEELATSAEELASQADQLKNLIDFFKFDSINKINEHLRPDQNALTIKEKNTLRKKDTELASKIF